MRFVSLRAESTYFPHAAQRSPYIAIKGKKNFIWKLKNFFLKNGTKLYLCDNLLHSRLPRLIICKILFLNLFLIVKLRKL